MRAVLFIVILAVAGGGAYFYFGQADGNGGGRPPRGPVPTTAWTLEEQPFQSRVQALGTLRAWESVVITSSRPPANSWSRSKAVCKFDPARPRKPGSGCT